VVALVVGLPILLWGIFASATVVLPWFVPVCDAVAVVSMVAVALLGSMDVELRRNRRSLPIVFVATATAAMWIGHFAIFPGDLPFLDGQRFNQATSTLFLGINLATPLMLAVALLTRAGPISNPRRHIFVASAGGVAFGVALIAFSVMTATKLETISSTGEFFAADALVGAAGLIPAVIGLLAFLAGLHGDERIARGVLAALTFSALNSLSLLYLHARWTPSWYADHVLALLPYVALLAGQLWLYSGSVIAERSAAERRRIGLAIAEAMATETDLMPVVDQLLAGVLDAIKADRVVLLRLVRDGFIVERGVDRDDMQPANVGHFYPLSSVVVGTREVVREAVEKQTPVVAGGYRVIASDIDPEKHADLEQSIVMPLSRGGAVDWVLIAARRTDQRFIESDVDQLRELGAIAALLIRNAGLLTEAESTSQAKTNFINLAAHELGTPISVIRGYADMLGDESLGPLTGRQRFPVDTIRKTSTDLAERVEQLLLASRLAGVQHGPTPAEMRTDLVECVRDALSRAADRAHLIGATLGSETPSEPVVARASPRDVAIILDNLLNNAMTYSRPPAHVSVEVQDGETAQVRVTDNGIGIPDGDREHIFDQFFRVDDSDFGYPPGTGLGLYISRRLAERNGGQLFVERSDPVGSVFTLRLARSDVEHDRQIT
jgi:signal transduction histidine kinase